MKEGNIVPTLDIDLAWHTHMLFPGHYINDTKELIGFTPDHDDDMPKQELELQREKTQALWDTIYGEDRYDTKNYPTKIRRRKIYIQMLVFALLLSAALLYLRLLKNDHGSTAFTSVAQATADWLVPVIIVAIVILAISICCYFCRRRELGGQWKSYTVTIAKDPKLNLPITWTKDSDQRFMVVSLTLDRGSYESTGGDIIANDIITKINDEDLYGPRKTVEFERKDAGFVLKDLKVIFVEDGKQAQSNDILVGMAVCEFDGQVVTSDKHFTELMESTTGCDETCKITFRNV